MKKFVCFVAAWAVLVVATFQANASDSYMLTLTSVNPDAGLPLQDCNDYTLAYSDAGLTHAEDLVRGGNYALQCKHTAGPVGATTCYRVGAHPTVTTANCATDVQVSDNVLFDVPFFGAEDQICVKSAADAGASVACNIFLVKKKTNP
jgi:hypothetical protein